MGFGVVGLKLDGVFAAEVRADNVAGVAVETRDGKVLGFAFFRALELLDLGEFAAGGFGRVGRFVVRGGRCIGCRGAAGTAAGRSVFGEWVLLVGIDFRGRRRGSLGVSGWRGRLGGFSGKGELLGGGGRMGVRRAVGGAGRLVGWRGLGGACLGDADGGTTDDRETGSAEKKSKCGTDGHQG